MFLLSNIVRTVCNAKLMNVEPYCFNAAMPNSLFKEEQKIFVNFNITVISI